tara:strand:- start:401 stop:913 length:513 start_codon:yes stop_codon:yes gene_type:complete
MALGRPSKFEERFIDEAIDFVGEQGKSVTQLAKHFRVSKSTVYLWAQQNKEFSDALTLARDWSEAYWEDKFVGFMQDNQVNAPLVKLYFANRFRWTDKQVDQKTEFTFIAGATPLQNAEHILTCASRGELPTSVALNYISAIKSIIEIDQATEVKARLEEIEKALNLGGN